MTSTGLNDDFSKLAVMRTAEMDWAPSPSPTVWRKRMELSGETEKGRVSSVVRYDADSRFPAHDHPMGEEFLVLEGTFSDEHGDYPAGTYVLNPQGFVHAPFSKKGCVLLVKLCQYVGAERERVVIDTNDAAWQSAGFTGREVIQLYKSKAYPEDIRLVRLAPGAWSETHDHPGGEEVFVLTGVLEDENGRYDAGTWARHAHMSRHRSGTDEGCTLYVKCGHLFPKS